MEYSQPFPAEMKPAYHHGQKTKRNRTVDQTTRPFIAWDGEGINLDGEGKPQSYVLFGSSEGCITHPEGLTAFECLDYILETGEANPTAVHCGFAFSYDANMILAGLSPVTLARLQRNRWTRIRRKDGSRYTVSFIPGKYFRVTKYRPEYHSRHNSTAKTTVTIFDIFSFFMKSFIDAYTEWVGPVPELLRRGKGKRGQFSIDEFAFVEKYWRLEIAMLRELAEELRRRVFAAGLHIRQWYGPGALASYALKAFNVKAHRADSNDAVRLASRYAYAGGRFELYRIGRTHQTVYGIDINSAYPFAISQLPSMVEGTWSHVDRPTKVTRFGVYHIRMKRGGGFTKQPSPLFHRDVDHNITFPWFVDGWYWSPEAHAAMSLGGELIEGWEYRGAKTLPFAYIPETYLQRQEWKRAGIGAEKGLKLMMNATYGKLAQRVGWDPIRQRMPPFHQLEWAGWVTSHARAQLFDIMRRIPVEHLIAVETDGIFTTYPIDKLGITPSDDLGGWSVDTYSDVLYVQSGLAWLRKLGGKDDGKWIGKRRGLDPCKEGHEPEECRCPDVFSLAACREFLAGLHAHPNSRVGWRPFVGKSTRFVGMGQALGSSRGFPAMHCVWATNDREITPGLSGKRVHVPFACDACQNGSSAWEEPHQLVIRSNSLLNPHSFAHSIPWEPEEGHARWRDYAESEDDLVTLQYV